MPKMQAQSLMAASYSASDSCGSASLHQPLITLLNVNLCDFTYAPCHGHKTTFFPLVESDLKNTSLQMKTGSPLAPPLEGSCPLSLCTGHSFCTILDI